MKNLLIVIAIMFSVHSVGAKTFTVSSISASEFADAESSTNVQVCVSRDNTREMEIHLDFEETAAGSIEVAFGKDSNENGALDPEERDTIYSWRAGRFCIENVHGGERIENGSFESIAGHRFDIRVKLDSSLVPKRLTAVCDGMPAFGELLHLQNEWLFRESWNMARITRRGAGDPNELVHCKFRYDGLSLKIR